MLIRSPTGWLTDLSTRIRLAGRGSFGRGGRVQKKDGADADGYRGNAGSPAAVTYSDWARSF